MVLPLLLTAITACTSRSADPESVTLRYKWKTGDVVRTLFKGVSSQRTVLGAHVSNDTFTDETVLRTVIEEKFADETFREFATLERFEQRFNGRKVQIDPGFKPIEDYADICGYPAHLPGSMRIYPSNELPPTPGLFVLPREAIRVGDQWVTLFKNITTSEVIAGLCTLTKVNHLGGRTFATIRLEGTSDVVPYYSGDFSHPEKTMVSCKGKFVCDFIFDVSRGVFMSGSGATNTVCSLLGTLNGRDVTEKLIVKAKLQMALLP